VIKVVAHLSSGADRIHATVTGDRGKLSEASGQADTGFEIAVPNAQLWSPEHPFLYGLKVEIKNQRGATVDAVGSYFGMRSVSLGRVNGELRPMLNGKFVFELGPLDQGYWPDGHYTAPTDAALKFDLETTKKLGFNMVRKHAKVEPQRWYYWADKLGLLVWQDMPTMWSPDEEPTHAQFEHEWQTIMEQHHNSPAIVVWVPFNENWGGYDMPRITDWTKKQDPTRLVDGNTGYNNAPRYRTPPGDPGNGDFDDRHIYVGPCRPPVPSSTRAAALGEYGGVGLFVPGHMWPVKNNAYEMQPTVEALTTRYEGLQMALQKLIEQDGLGAAVYTQITDVEHEVNGFLTYDRKFEKMDFSRVRAANEAVLKAAAALNEPAAAPSK
jgi:hypothetical protein